MSATLAKLVHRFSCLTSVFFMKILYCFSILDHALPFIDLTRALSARVIDTQKAVRFSCHLYHSIIGFVLLEGRRGTAGVGPATCINPQQHSHTSSPLPHSQSLSNSATCLIILPLFGRNADNIAVKLLAHRWDGPRAFTPSS